MLVVGSYVVAERVKVRRPLQRGEVPATRATAIPTVEGAPVDG